MKNVLLYIWQFPQNVLGLLLWGVLRIAGKFDYAAIYPHYPFKLILTPIPGFGVTLGKYIFIGKLNAPDVEIHHEKGHGIQSRRFGLIYLFAVGIPSLILSFRHRVLHRGWTYEARQKWYYSRWPENNADKLGGVKRG